jgi:hypothetical protein
VWSNGGTEANENKEGFRDDYTEENETDNILMRTISKLF